jgi:acetylornithine deacetylase/succinyl-diaminopimelate desuccinylase-like protein
MSSKAIEFAQQNQSRFLEELKDFLRIQSVSTLPEHKPDILAAANKLAGELTRIGFEHVELIDNGGNPLVYGDWLHAAGKPTALAYGHYDVQPVEPLEEWKTKPFEPTQIGDDLFGRGGSDDKGQVWMQVKAFESLFLTSGGKLPINVRCIFEGEEETTGASIEKFVSEHPERLKSDFALIADTELFAKGLPTLCVGLRGNVYYEVEVQAAATDLHSGMYGGAAPNPIFALAEIFTKIKDENGHILIPGFYDDVKVPTDAELAAWKALPFDEEHYRKTEVGSDVLTGEPGYSVLYRTWARPTFEVHGIVGGFVGNGAKTVIPAKATAKVSTRLVPDQDPEKAVEQFSKYVKSIAPKGTKVSIRVLSKGPASVVSTDSPFIKAASAALQEVFHKETVYVRSGGSIPIAAQFQSDLGIPSVMMGFGLPDDNIHAPNEKFHLPNYFHGIESMIRFLSNLGQ